MSRRHPVGQAGVDRLLRRVPGRGRHRLTPGGRLPTGTFGVDGGDVIADRVAEIGRGPDVSGGSDGDQLGVVDHRPRAGRHDPVIGRLDQERRG
jgi:hypothetical protein